MMGTRSRIGVMHGDKVKSIYCHWDGYLDFNGEILQEHYDSAKANQLVALGDMSSLRPELGEPHALHMTYIVPGEFQQRHEFMEHWCTFYGRDGGEKGTEWKVATTFDQFLGQCDECGAEYYYIMKDGVWYCGDTYESTPLSKKLTVLADVLQAETVDQ
jgi:hypothetical protein